MPFTSQAQRRLFHSKGSPVGPDTVKEFDAATKGKKLPEHVPGSKSHRAAHVGKAIKKAHADYNKRYGENPYNAHRM